MHTIRLLILMWLATVSVALRAAWTPESLPMVHLTDARRYVCNPDGLMSAAAVDSTDILLHQLEQQKGVQTVVVIVRRIEGGDPYEFGMALARKYGVGDREQNSGLIIVISTEDRNYFILTGNGLEGTLPDAVCNRVGRDIMVPYLRNGNWDAAVYATVRALAAYIDGDASLHAATPPRTSDGQVAGLIIALVFFLVIFVFSMSRSRKLRGRQRCPQCHRRTLHATHAQMARRPDGKLVRQVTYQCDHCNYVELRDEDANDHFHGGILIPPIFFLGGMRAGGFGRHGGGSFGGGSFGGGGAGGRF